MEPYRMSQVSANTKDHRISVKMGPYKRILHAS